MGRKKDKHKKQDDHHGRADDDGMPPAPQTETETPESPAADDGTFDPEDMEGDSPFST